MTTKINQDQAELATETTAGIVERATDAEAATGTDTTRYVTPAHINSGTQVFEPDGATVYSVTFSWSWSISDSWFTPAYTWHVLIDVVVSSSSSGSNVYWPFNWDIYQKWYKFYAQLSTVNPSDSRTDKIIIPVFKWQPVTLTVDSFNDAWNNITFNVKWTAVKLN